MSGRHGQQIRMSVTIALSRAMRRPHSVALFDERQDRIKETRASSVKSTAEQAGQPSSLIILTHHPHSLILQLVKVVGSKAVIVVIVSRIC